MSVQKTYSITIKYSRDDAGRSGTVRGVAFTTPELSESDPEYVELRKVILKRLADVVPVSQGICNAHISGEVSEA